MKTHIILAAAVAAILTGCDARVENNPPASEKTTIVTPAAPTENKTTIVNPPAKTETNTTIVTPPSSSSSTTTTTTK